MNNPEFSTGTQDMNTLAGNSTGSLNMNRTKRILALLAGAFWLCAGPLAATVVNDVRVSDEGDQLRFIMVTDEPPAEPTVFTTDQPPRIVVEIPDSSSTFGSGENPVGIGPVQSFMAISSGDRTRMVVNLSRPVGYEVDVEGNRIVLSVESGGAAGRVATSGTGETNEIESLDFRRGDEGESRVLVRLDEPGVDISVDERATELRVVLYDTRLPEDLMQQLDVTDFATPVQMITPEVRGSNVRLMLDTAGAYEHVAYQTGDQLVIEVTEPETEPRMAQELEFFQDREYTGERITLNFQDIAVRSVLQLIADISDLNIVVSDSVTGNLTLRLTNVPWDQALDIVLRSDVELHIMPVNVAAEMTFDWDETVARFEGEHDLLDFLLHRWYTHLDGGRHSRTIWDLALIQAVIFPELASQVQIRTSRERGDRSIWMYDDIDADAMREEFFRSVLEHVAVLE